MSPQEKASLLGLFPKFRQPHAATDEMESLAFAGSTCDICRKSRPPHPAASLSAVGATSAYIEEAARLLVDTSLGEAQ